VSWSRLTACLLAAAIGFLPLAPSEHVHEETDDSGHHTLVVHRHAQLHAPGAAAAEHGTTGESAVAQQRATVDHADPITLFPDDTYTAPTPYFVQPPAVAVVSMLPPAPPRAVVRRLRASDQLIHAPPRAPASLRAPPSASFL